MPGNKSAPNRHRAGETRLSIPGWVSRAAVAAVLTLIVGATAYVVSTSRGGGDSVASTADHPVSRTAAQHAAPQQQGNQAQPVVAGTTITHLTKSQMHARAERRAAAKAAKIAARSFSFRIASFNVLGSQHSTPSGDHSRYPSAGTRDVGAVSLIHKYDVDVVGTQETQPDQLHALMSMTGFAAYPGYQFGDDNTDNSILYNPDKFEFVSGTSFPITFMHAVRPQTVLLLRDKATGREVYFVNMHASAGHDGHDTATRIAGHLSAAHEVDQLKASGIPVFVTGDMNDREAFFCRFAPATDMVAAQGGSIAGGCHPGPHLAVDWILSTTDVQFSNYVEDRSPIGRISDHFFVTATAKVEPHQKQ